MTTHLFSGAALAGLLVVAACGSGNEADRSSNAVAGSDTTVPVYLIDIPPTTDGAAPGASSDFCQLNLEISESSESALSPETADSAAVERWFDEEFPRLFDRLVEVAPAELRADLELVGSSILAFRDALARVDWNPALVFTDPALQEFLQDTELAAAGARLDAYCGLGE
ncbi:MAG: hypothetical protein ACKOA2_10740 [Ilumatobacteraceae bacterium]